MRARTQIHTRERASGRHTLVLKSEGSERGIGRTARREGVRKRAPRADREKEKEREGGTERPCERERERVREIKRSVHTRAGRARSRALGTHTCTPRAHAYHRTAEKTARERRSNGQTEPRANQVLWPVAFPITLRLGSPPVCVPKKRRGEQLGPSVLDIHNRRAS